jgi:hypothetical protein
MNEVNMNYERIPETGDLVEVTDSHDTHRGFVSAAATRADGILVLRLRMEAGTPAAFTRKVCGRDVPFLGENRKDGCASWPRK